MKAYSRRCKHCGAPIIGRRSFAKHCSDACRRAWTNSRPANRARKRKHDRAQYAAGLRYTPVAYRPRLCAQCGESFKPKQARSVLCSKICKWLAYKAKRQGGLSRARS